MKLQSYVMGKSIMVFLALLFYITQAFSQRGKGDVVYLKNGSIINGQIVSLLPNGQVKIKTRDNSLWVFESAGIDSIRKSFNIRKITSIQSGFFNLTEAGILTGNSNNSKKAPFSLINICGWKFNNRISAGVGTGVEFLNETYLPVLADFRYYLKRQGGNPFFGIQGGYNIALEKPDRIYSDPIMNYSQGYYLNSTLKMKANGGFLLNPMVGICTSLGGNLAFTISAGYRIMRNRYSRADEYKIDIDYSRLSLKVGLLLQ